MSRDHLVSHPAASTHEHEPAAQVVDFLRDNGRNLAIGAVVLVLGIGGNLALPNGLFPFPIPVLFPSGIPAIVFSAIVGILLNILFIILPPSRLGATERTYNPADDQAPGDMPQ